MQPEIERCRNEIAEIEAHLRSGHRDLHVWVELSGQEKSCRPPTRRYSLAERGTRADILWISRS